MSDHVTWLTQAAYDKLAAELEERQGPLRAEIVQRIAAARAEGDLSENGGYHAAREEQGKNESRIKHLQHLLEHAKVGTPEVPDGEAHIGRVVTVTFADGEQETYFIGDAAEAAHIGHPVLTPSSPLGSALLGHAVGDEITYTLPNGKSLTVTLEDVQAH